MNNTILSADNLSVTFSNGGVQQHVLKNLNLRVYDGDFTVIMGASGSGKSTLLYSLSGMQKVSIGEVNYNGEKISGYSNDKLAVFRRKNCGFVFQQVYLLENMSVSDNALAAGYLVKNNRKAVINRANALFDRVNISAEMRKKFPSQLSGGEAQRCGIVRALINEPKLLFADEPTGALNSANGKAVLDLMTELNNDGQSILMVTHDIKSARRANRIIYLSDGTISGELDLGHYVSGDHTRHEKLRAFLAEMGW